MLDRLLTHFLALTRPMTISVSKALGVRPQHIALMLLGASLVLDYISESYSLFNAAFHTLVIGGMILANYDAMRRIEQNKHFATPWLRVSVEGVRLYFPLSLLSLVIAMAGRHKVQITENILDLFTLAFTFTFMMKPPSLWQRFKQSIRQPRLATNHA